MTLPLIKSDNPKTHGRLVVMGLLISLNLFYGANFTAIAPVIPEIMAHFHINKGSASMFVSVVILVQAAMVIPGGMLVARSPLKLVFGLGWFISGATVLTALVDSFGFMLVLRGLYGLGFALIMPATAPVLMRWFKPSHLPFVNGLNLTSFILGNALGLFATAPLASLIGWQNTLSLLGGALLTGSLAWALFAHLPPASRESSRVLSFKDMLSVIRSKTTLLLGFGDAVAFSQFAALTTWLPTYYNESFGMSLTRAGIVVGLIPLVGVVGTFMGGVVSARTGTRRPFFMVCGILISLAGFGTFAFNNQAVIFISAIMLGLATFFYFPVLLTVPMEIKNTTEGSVAVTWAAMMGISNSMAVLAPISVGAMTDSLGSFVPGLSLWAALAFGLFIVGVALPVGKPVPQVLESG